MAKHKTSPSEHPVLSGFARGIAPLCVQSVWPKKVALAVSGGADSAALLHVAQDWAKEHAIDLLVLTMDHGFRSESADEARMVAAYCTDHGLEHRILQWEGERPISAMQEQARFMRRRLLCEACVTHGATHLLLGHQADDQAETFIMRVLRGSGLTGLASMKLRAPDDASGVIVCRPFLGVRRAALRDYCMAHEMPFVDDPSNENPQFERVRLRHMLEAFPELADGVVRSTERLARADEALQEIAAAWVQTYACEMSERSVWIPLAVWRDVHREIRVRILGYLLDQIMNKDPAHRTAYAVQLSLLENWEEQMLLPDFKGSNLGGCWASPKKRAKEDGMIFRPEPIRAI